MRRNYETHDFHRRAEKPDDCDDCADEAREDEDITLVEVTVNPDGSYRVVQLTDVGAQRRERK